MKKTEYGLRITLDELEQILERAKRESKHNNMEHCVYIDGDKMTQYCCYAECNPISYHLSYRE